MAAPSAQTAETLPVYGSRSFSRLAAALVLLCAVLPYLGTLHYQFAYDDDTQVLDNPVIGSWRFLPAYFTKPVAGFFHGVHAARYYRPLFFVWLRLNYAAWGTHSVGWHVTNLILHAAASLLALAILRRYFADIRWAVAGAALFAVHPAHVETVAWVSGCTDSLMAVGLFGSLLLWMRGEESESSAARAISLLCYALALLSKETAVVLPILIFLHAFFGVPARSGVSGRKFLQALRSAMPYVLVAAIFLTVRHFVLRSVPTGAMWVWPSHALLTIPSLLLFYARHLLWPVNLTLFYALPIVSSPASAAFLIPVLTLAILCIALFFAFYRRRDSRGLLAGAWFLLPLAPLLYIAEFQRDDFAHDRYLYLPVLALSILLGCLCEWLGRSASSRQIQRLPDLVPAALIILFALLTVVESRPWENDLTLYLNAVRVSPKHPLARNNLAREYEQLGRFNDAEALLAGLVQERPDLWLANYNYGYVNYRLGKFPAAESYLQRAVQIDPREPDQHLYLGATYLKQGRLAMAETELHTAIAGNPEGAGYHYTLGIIYWQQGRLAAAEAELSLEIQYHPETAAVRTQLEALKSSMGQSLH